MISAECQLLGEMGLDFACPIDRSAQERLLRCQLQLAERVQLPIILHCVKAFEPLMQILNDYSLQGVIFHGFIGSWQQAKRALAKGFYLSFGERTFSSSRTCEVLRKISQKQLFLESDESPTPIEEIYRRVAEMRATAPEALMAAMQENYQRVFTRNGK